MADFLIKHSVGRDPWSTGYGGTRSREFESWVRSNNEISRVKLRYAGFEYSDLTEK